MDMKLWLTENMKNIKEVIWLVTLCICAWTDFKRKQIRKEVVFAAAILLTGLTLFSYQSISAIQSVNLLPGFFMLLISFLSREKIGYGDGICLILSGLALPWRQFMGSMFFSFILMLILSILLMITKKATWNTKLPYVPFLLIGTCIGITVE